MEDPGPTPARQGSTEGTPSAPVEPRGVGSSNRRIQLLDRPGIVPNDPMGEAGRKALRFHFRRMLYHEPGTRAGDDIEALHDMRVATRRMRAAFRVFGLYYESKAIRPYLKGLRRTGRALGSVRDLDVLREEVQGYRDRLPEAKQASLDGLLAVLETQREAARDRMNSYLDGEKYQRFVDGFGRFVETEGMGSLPVQLDGKDPSPYRVCHAAPVAIYSRWAKVRAYDEWVRVANPPLGRLHALRIVCKRLRYTLEFFQEVLGPDTEKLITEVVAMQDHLGALQDAVVASDILRAYLGQRKGDPDASTGDQPALSGAEEAVVVTGYLAAQQSTMQRLVDAFPAAWEKLNGANSSRLVAEAVMVL